LQPLSPVLQPPWPLQAFCPLHPCFPLSASARVCRETPAFPAVLAAWARTAKDPVNSPATAAPAITALDGMIIICNFFRVDFLASGTSSFWRNQQVTGLPIDANGSIKRTHRRPSFFRGFQTLSLFVPEDLCGWSHSSFWCERRAAKAPKRFRPIPAPSHATNIAMSRRDRYDDRQTFPRVLSNPASVA
jgi:hypothetical protein